MKFLKIFLIIFSVIFSYYIYSSIFNVNANSYINTQRPICNNIQITNLTKNLSCNSSNPRNCKVSKGDKLKFNIEANGGNFFYYVIEKEYSDSKIFFETSGSFSEVSDYTTTVDNNIGLVRYEVNGFVRYLDGTERSNLNNNSNYSKCRIVFDLPQNVGNPLNDNTPSCVSMDIKILSRNNYQCRRNSGDCPVNKNDEIELTVESSKQNSNIIGYMIYKDYSDGTSVMQENYTTGINGSKQSYKIRIDNDPQIVNYRIIGTIGYPVSVHHFNLVSNSFSCVANFNYPISQGNNTTTPTTTKSPTPTPTNTTTKSPTPTPTNNTNNSNVSITPSPNIDSNNNSANDNGLDDQITNNNQLSGNESLLFSIKQVSIPTKPNNADKYEFYVDLEVKNLAKTKVSINNIDLKTKYDTYLLKLKKVVIEKDDNKFDFEDSSLLKNFVLSNLEGKVSDSVSDLNENELYRIRYYFEISNKASNNKYCVDFVSDKYNKNINECVYINESESESKFNLWWLVLVLIVILIVVISIILWLNREKIKLLITRR